MSIATDSKQLEDIKDPETCHIFALYRLLASEEEQAEMRQNYLNGGYGYGHAKQALFDLIVTKYASQRERYFYLMDNKAVLDNALKKGAEKAMLVANAVLTRVRSKIGY